MREENDYGTRLLEKRRRMHMARTELLPRKHASALTGRSCIFSETASVLGRRISA